MTRVDLHGANFEFSNLSGVVLQDVNLEGADFVRAGIDHASIEHVNLRMADLEDCRLSYTRFRDVDLSGARLAGACLIGSDLRTARLNGAYLRGACNEEMEYLLTGLRYAAVRAAEAGHIIKPSVLRITRVIFDELYYQEDALSYAVANWMFKHFSLDIELPPVVRDPEKDWLVFQLPEPLSGSI